MVFLLNIYLKYREWVLWKYFEIAIIDIYIFIIQLTTEIYNEDKLM